MLRNALIISLIFSGFLTYIAEASEAQCASLLLRNMTDQSQSSIVKALIKNAQTLLDDAQKYASLQTKCPDAETLSNKPTDGIEAISDKQTDSAYPVSKKPADCAEILEKNNSATSGVYKIWLRNLVTTTPIDVFCDMDDDGGGWTVIQRRGDFDSGEYYFYKEWEFYKTGFGDLRRDFWLGNDNIFGLTYQRVNVALKITLTDWQGNKTYATYGAFSIDDESRQYTLHVYGYNGTAGDSLSYHNGQAFTTKDHDNDQNPENCAIEYKGAWWYKICTSSNLNGLYIKEIPATRDEGIVWSTFKGYSYSLKESVIKIRPRDFKKNRDGVTPH